jgi:DNA invertase Pin-like site-specific DNA recombinase
MVTTAGSRTYVAYNEAGRRIGETHANARIPDSVVDLIRERHEDDAISYAACSKEFRLSLPTVKKILTYQRRAQTAARWKALVHG